MRRSLPPTVSTSQSSVTVPTAGWRSVLRAVSCGATGRCSHSAANRGLARRRSSISARSGSSAGWRPTAACRSAAIPASKRGGLLLAAHDARLEAGERAPGDVALARRPAREIADQRGGERVRRHDLPRRVDHHHRDVGEPVEHALDRGREVPAHARPRRAQRGRRRGTGARARRRSAAARGPAARARTATGCARGPARAGRGSRPRARRAARAPPAAGRARAAARRPAGRRRRAGADRARCAGRRRAHRRACTDDGARRPPRGSPCESQDAPSLHKKRRRGPILGSMTTTLITGANKGLGYETARRLLASRPRRLGRGARRRPRPGRGGRARRALRRARRHRRRERRGGGGARRRERRPRRPRQQRRRHRSAQAGARDDRRRRRGRLRHQRARHRARHPRVPAAARALAQPGRRQRLQRHGLVRRDDRSRAAGVDDRRPRLPGVEVGGDDAHDAVRQGVPADAHQRRRSRLHRDRPQRPQRHADRRRRAPTRSCGWRSSDASGPTGTFVDRHGEVPW